MECSILDEIREVPDARDLDSTVSHASFNGSGKGRMTKSMTAQRTLNWQLLILSSGEIKLSEYAAAAGARIKAGAEVRLINIPADAGAGYGVFEEFHGLFEELHGAERAAKFAQHLKAAAKEIYGTPLRAFLAEWVRDWDRYCARVVACMTEFIKKALPPGAAPEVGRGLRRVALVAAAGELATSMGITGWEPGEAWRAALRCVQDWIADRGGIGQADVEAGIRQVRAFFEAHGSSRFQPVVARVDAIEERIMNRVLQGPRATRSCPATSPRSPRQPVWMIEERIMNRVGFWREENGERVFLVFPEAFRDQVCHGFDCRMIAKELQARGLLLKGDGNNLTRKERLPGFTETARVYVILGRILADGDPPSA